LDITDSSKDNVKNIARLEGDIEGIYTGYFLLSKLVIFLKQTFANEDGSTV